MEWCCWRRNNPKFSNLVECPQRECVEDDGLFLLSQPDGNMFSSCEYIFSITLTSGVTILAPKILRQVTLVPAAPSEPALSDRSYTTLNAFAGANSDVAEMPLKELRCRDTFASGIGIAVATYLAIVRSVVRQHWVCFA